MKRWLSNFFSNPPKRDLMLNHRPEPIIENPEFRSGDRQKTFALDLSSQTMPYQLVVAQLRPAMTLEKLIQDLECKIDGFSNKHILIQWDTLRVPNILFRITQEFAELEGTNVTNVGPIVKPTQIIDFKLDRFGAEVASRADAKLIGIGLGSYLFDQPFLVLMKRRGNKHPFFAMWVDNAGLLKKA